MYFKTNFYPLKYAREIQTTWNPAQIYIVLTTFIGVGLIKKYNIKLKNTNIKYKIYRGKISSENERIWGYTEYQNTV